MHKPNVVFTTPESGVLPDHKAVTDIVVNGVFYARRPKWQEIPGGEALKGVPYAEAFKSGSPLLVGNPEVFSGSQFR